MSLVPFVAIVGLFVLIFWFLIKYNPHNIHQRETPQQKKDMPLAADLSQTIKPLADEEWNKLSDGLREAHDAGKCYYLTPIHISRLKFLKDDYGYYLVQGHNGTKIGF